ncbi:MAG: hypothetical protein IVW53_07875 [Chloroflexi bacterium]|nr:hypothetical protein [Chloroflexota bacterium]
MTDTPRPLRPAPPDDIVELVRIIVLLQAATLTLATLETTVWFVAFGPTVGPSLALTAMSAMLTYATAVGLRRHARWARRVTLVAESLVFAGGSIDAVLALVVAGGPPPLVVALTRIAVPVLVIVLLRRPTARAAFGRLPATATP